MPLPEFNEFGDLPEGKHRASLDRVAQALLEKETLVRDEVEALLADVPVESRSSDFVGVKQVVPISEEQTAR